VRAKRLPDGRVNASRLDSLRLLHDSEMGGPAAATPGRPCGLHVFISNPQLLFNLQNSLRRAGCVVEQRRSHELEVDVLGAPSEEQARRELNVYLATWQATNPGVEAYIVEPPRPGTS
jgi:hypothetical protein